MVPNEDFLSHIWQFQKFNQLPLTTTSGETIEVINPGVLNRNEGPDFKGAKIKIGQMLWSGQVEIHRYASDWYKHAHEQNSKYETTILHVVWISDQEVQFSSGEILPELEISGIVDSKLIERYKNLSYGKNEIPCISDLPDVPDLIKSDMLQRSVIERLELRSAEINAIFHESNQDLKQAFFVWLLKGYGFKTNDQAFMTLAERLTFKVISKHCHDLDELQALLFGVSGFLSEPIDDFSKTMSNTYAFLKHKYGLMELSSHDWNFSRIRPSGFPKVRIAQLCALLYEHEDLWSLLKIDDAKFLSKQFQIEVPKQWVKHNEVDRKVGKPPKKMGKSSADLLVNNVIIPFLCFASERTMKADYKERALNLLQQLPRENNFKIRAFDNQIENKSAHHSQGLIQLYSNYCTQKKCLNCKIGCYLLNRNVVSQEGKV